MKCFACDRKIGYNALTAETRDAQVVFVGRECAKLIEAAGEAGYQPPKGGPRLYSIHLKEAVMDKYYYIGLLVNERKLQVFADIRKAETVIAESGYDFVSAPFESIASAREELDRLILRLPSDFEAVKGLMAGGRSIYISKSEFQIVANELRRLRFARNGKKASYMGMETAHMRTLPENIVRFYVGCRPIARGGWYVGTVIVDSLGKELDGTKWRSEIATKKEAKALAASLNDELQA